MEQGWPRGPEPKCEHFWITDFDKMGLMRAEL